MLTHKQFLILEYLAGAGEARPQRAVAEGVGLSVGSVNKLMGELSSLGCVSGGGVTEAGLAALEPYRVRRAVFMAAGFGSRLVPVTLNTPKPLVRVKGKRIIDSLLDAVLEAGIEEIYIVRGYLGEQFDQLLYQYPMIRFIDNPIYNEANNISSAMYAGDLLKNAYMLEADLLMYNHGLIKPYQYGSNYLGVYTARTDDWCFETENGVIRRMSVGGENCYHMFGVSYWTEADGEKLMGHIRQVFDSPGGRERYFDEVPLRYHLADYQVAVRPCTFQDIVEIDTFGELKRLDPSYAV